MDKRDFVVAVAEKVRASGAKKSVHLPKRTLTVTDDNGGHASLEFKPSDKEVMYTKGDVELVVSACLDVIEESMIKGEKIAIYGFGELYVRQTKPKRILIREGPRAGEWVLSRTRFVPKFKIGNKLKTAAVLYGLSVNENANVKPPEGGVYDEECGAPDEESGGDD